MLGWTQEEIGGTVGLSIRDVQEASHNLSEVGKNVLGWQRKEIAEAVGLTDDGTKSVWVKFPKSKKHPRSIETQ